MVEHEANDTAATVAPSEAVVVRRSRIQSDIEFPYSDLESATELARVLHAKAGNSCNDDELAAWLDQSADGGTYRSRRSAARMFGLIEISQGRITLTDIGRDLSDPQKERMARIEAFVMPQLYHAMYEQCRGRVLPPAAAIERQMEQLGVSPKQKTRARQAFHKSAVFAGYIDQTSGRFVKPGYGALPERELERDDPDKGGGGGGNNDGGGTKLELDPLLIELLRKIPPKQDGWPAARRLRWFRTFAMNVSQIFDADDEPVELKIEVTKEDSSPK